MATLTITDIQFNEYRIFTTTDDNQVLHVWAAAGYTVTTAEGRDFGKQRIVELTGANRTTAQNLLAVIKNLIKPLEGL